MSSSLQGFGVFFPFFFGGGLFNGTMKYLTQYTQEGTHEEVLEFLRSVVAKANQGFKMKYLTYFVVNREGFLWCE